MKESTMRKMSCGRALALAVVIGGFAANAFGALLTPPVLDPTGVAPATGAYNEQACPTPQTCPTSGNSIVGSTAIFFGIITASGIANISLIQNVTPSTGGFFTFSYTVWNNTLDPGHATPVSTGGPPQVPPDFSVLLGDVYEIDMNWKLTATGTLQSAAWGVNVTTGPVIHQTPEPATLVLLGLGLAGLGFASRRKKI